MAATCIGLFLLTIVLEAVRRVGKEYDGFILRQFQRHVDARAAVPKMEGECCSDGPQTGHQTVIFRATPIQQLIRSLIRKFSPQPHHCVARRRYPPRLAPVRSLYPGLSPKTLPVATILRGWPEANMR